MLRGFSLALMEVAKVTTVGAEKYSPDGWLDVPDGIDRYDDAKARHMLEGYIETHDGDIGTLHMAQEAWNALAKLELCLRKEQK